MRATTRRLSALVLAALLGPAVPVARAAPPTPAEELLRFVPPDVSLCLVVRDLRGHAAALAASPFLEQLRRSPAGQQMQQALGVQRLVADQFLKKYLGLDAAQLRDDILGDAVVVAYRLGPPGKSQKEEGLLMVRARSAERLAALVDRVNGIVKESGELKAVEPCEHDGFKYFRRVERRETNFYCLRGPVLIFSGQEGMLRRALAGERKLAADEESAVGKQLRLLGAERALAAVWVNPRSYDDTLADKLRQAEGQEAAFLKTFLTVWKALDGVALTLSLGTDLELGLALRARPGAVPPAVRRFFVEAATRSDAWGRFPDDALLAAGARTGPAAFVELLAAFQTKEGAAALRLDLDRSLGAAIGGKDVVAEVFPHVGPDWGLCVTAPPRPGKQWFPRVVFAVRVRAGDKESPVDRGLVTGLNALAFGAVLQYNQKHKDRLTLKTVKQGKLEVRLLASRNGEAIGLQPAYALCDGYLVLASSPEALGRFAAARPVPAAGAEVPLLRLSLKDLRQYLADRRDPLAAALAEQHGLKAKEVAARLDGVVAALQLFDRVELVQKSAPGRVTLTLRLRPTHPLRKDK